MTRRFVVLGVCFLFLGLEALPARPANTPSTPGRVRQAGYSCQRCRGCGRTYTGYCCPHCGTRAPAAAAAPEAAAPAAPGVPEPPTPFVEEPGIAPAAPMDAMPPAGAVAAAPASMAPNMIGDFFRTGGVLYNNIYGVYTPSCSSFPGPGAIIGSTKIAENSSPLPQDRFFLNYSYFHNTPLYPGCVDVNRFTPGFEKTFLAGNASFEMRFPMAVTLDSTINVVYGGPGPDTSNGEFGNMAMTPKVLLRRTQCGALSMGMMITVPTADDINAELDDGTPVARIENDAVHLMPFVGFLYTPDPYWFAQGYLQYDVAANGNRTLVDYDGGGLQEVGYLNETTFQYLDLAVGRWLYRSCAPMCVSRLRSVAVAAEIHWNKSLQRGDYIEDIFYQIGNTAENVDIWDATIGLHVRLCDTTISLAYVAPLTDGLDKPFDGEFRLIVNRWFGRSSEAYGYGAYPFP